MTTLTSPHTGTAAGREIGSGWGWFVALGVALIVLGGLAFANLPTATAVSVYTIGILMLIGSAGQLAASFFARTAGNFWMLLLSAVLYGVAGGVTVANPTLAATALTVLLGCSLLVSGGSRIWFSFALSPLPGWGWITASGIVTALAGVVILAGWPSDTPYLLGMVLAFDLCFQGGMTIGWGFALKELTK
jgi:uncharacterized membrane protein HdeD (DUF308 family)